MASKLEDKIDQLIKAIQTVAPVAPIAPVAPVAPVLPVIQPYSGDHDLLNSLIGKVDRLQITVDKLSDREDSHITKSEFAEHIKSDEDHEQRIRSNEEKITKIMTYGSAGIILISIIEFAISNLLK